MINCFFYKKNILFIFLLFCYSLSCEDNGYLIVSNSSIDSKDFRVLYDSIDDSLFTYWKKGQFAREILSLCGCEPDGFAIESNHGIKDSIWAFNWCGSPDSVIKIVSKENIYEGLFYLPLKKKSKLFFMIKKLKNTGLNAKARKKNYRHSLNN
jgi:hypothetical protein